jgi:hypothetical protein
VDPSYFADTVLKQPHPDVDVVKKRFLSVHPRFLVTEMVWDGTPILVVVSSLDEPESAIVVENVGNGVESKLLTSTTVGNCICHTLDFRGVHLLDVHYIDKEDDRIYIQKVYLANGMVFYYATCTPCGRQLQSSTASSVGLTRHCYHMLQNCVARMLGHVL